LGTDRVLSLDPLLPPLNQPAPSAFSFCSRRLLSHEAGSTKNRRRLSTPVSAGPLTRLAGATWRLTFGECRLPTVLRSGPYRFFFYSADRDEPPHVHVEHQGDIAQFLDW